MACDLTVKTLFGYSQREVIKTIKIDLFVLQAWYW